MNLQELLNNKEIDLSKTKLVRHNMSDDIVSLNWERGHFDIYQSVQSKERFKNCEYIISFLGTAGKNATFVGCYKVLGFSPLDKTKLPADFAYDGFREDREYVFYTMEKLDVLHDLENRLVIEWKNPRAWHQHATNEMEVLFIQPSQSLYSFSSYDKVLLKFTQLEQIISNKQNHIEWYNRLSTVAGVYLITDQSTGKHYVGSASSEDGGIWGRWSDYVKSKHGGNKRLRELMDNDPNHCKNFLFSILEAFPIKRDRHDIWTYEQLYKKKLCSIAFGLNDN